MSPPVVGGPPGGAPPAPAQVPHLPFAGDFGTLTGWLLEKTATETSEAISRDINSGFERLATMPCLNENEHDEAMRNLVDEVLNSDTLGCYLTVTNTGATSAKVTVIHSLARYSAGFGGNSSLQGRILGFLGETVGTQLPTFVGTSSAPGDDLAHGFTLEDVDVPTAIQVEAYFNGPAAGNLMPAIPAGVNSMLLCPLVPLPLAWVPYFLDSKTPYAAYQMGAILVASLETGEHRARAEPLLDWLRTSCVRLGAAGAERFQSRLDMSFEPIAPDPRVIRWATARLAPFVKTDPLQATTGAGAGPTSAPNVPGVNIANERDYTPLEIAKIQAACSLTPGMWDTNLPELYSRMLEEGRTKAKVRSLLEDIFRPGESGPLDAVHVSVTSEMATDIKELNFGQNGNTGYDTCHRGISPFAVISVSLATESKRRRIADRFTRTRNLTLAEVEQEETSPDPIPQDYRGLMDLLRTYLAFLEGVVGEQCDHYGQVYRIAAELSTQRRTYENMAGRAVASLLWQIFTDARFFFSAGLDARGTLPVSRLQITHSMLSTGFIQEQVHVPYAQLGGHTPGGDDEADTSAGANSDGRQQGGRGNRTFRHVPTCIKTCLRGARGKYPNLKVVDLMNAPDPNLTYNQVKLGPTGSCLDYLCFGRCKTPACTYKHETNASIPSDRAEAVAQKLGPAYLAYDASH